MRGTLEHGTGAWDWNVRLHYLTGTWVAKHNVTVFVSNCYRHYMLRKLWCLVEELPPTGRNLTMHYTQCHDNRGLCVLSFTRHGQNVSTSIYNNISFLSIYMLNSVLLFITYYAVTSLSQVHNGLLITFEKTQSLYLRLLCYVVILNVLPSRPHCTIGLILSCGDNWYIVSLSLHY